MEGAPVAKCRTRRPYSFLGGLLTFQKGRAPTDPESADAARELAVRLLAARPRGRSELARALADRGFSRPAAENALDRLERDGALDDLEAARSVVRLRGGRYGRARIERELKARRFSRETIGAAFDAEDIARREEESLRRAFERLWKARTHMAPALRRRRVFDALTRRGFPAEKISEIIRDWYEID